MSQTFHPPTDRDRLLRWSLRGNAAFSALCGAAFLLAARPLAETAGVPDPRLLTALGANLLGFAALLVFVAARREIPLAAPPVVVWLDLAWVAGTVPLVLADVLTGAGRVAAVAVADVVLVFAALQYLGIRRVRAPRRALATG